MRVLLDHNLDWRLVRALPDEWEIATTRSQGWAASENGALLAVAQTQFDLFITTDKAMYGQQNVPLYDIAVIVLRVYSNRLPDLLPFAEAIIDKAGHLESGQVEWLYADEKLPDRDRLHHRGPYAKVK
jgi:predicted nuclease of predicted toxin-antitoxin system